MGKIIACIDDSSYADGVCALSAWASNRTGLAVSLLHVLSPHSELTATADMSGQIGLGAKSALLEQLTNLDETYGKNERQKGVALLENAKKKVSAQGGSALETLQRRGDLAEELKTLQKDADLIVMGRCGKNHQDTPGHLGSNIEQVAHSVHTRLLISPPKVKQPLEKFLIAYDGSLAAEKALDYAARDPLLQKLECHILTVSDTSSEAQKLLDNAEKKLNKAGVSAYVSLKSGPSVEAVVSAYASGHEIDLLIIGAYGHSKIKRVILGSVTSALISRSNIPVMLFHS